MASIEAQRLRAECFPNRDVPRLSVAEIREATVDRARTRELPADVRVLPATIGAMEAEWIETRGRDNALLYLHGGGFVAGGFHSHRALAARLGIASACSVLVPDYALAPEHPFPAALDDAGLAYAHLIDRGFAPQQIVLAGDSAGANLAVALLQRLVRNGAPRPAAALLISPWLDLALTGESYCSRRLLDPLDRETELKRLAGLYAPNVDLTCPEVSPLFGEVCGLPPLIIQVGDHEVLLDDSTRFAARVRESGGQVELRVWPEMWHLWQLGAPGLPEAISAIGEAGNALQNLLAAAARERGYVREV